MPQLLSYVVLVVLSASQLRVAFCNPVGRHLIHICAGLTTYAQGSSCPSTGLCESKKLMIITGLIIVIVFLSLLKK